MKSRMRTMLIVIAALALLYSQPASFEVGHIGERPIHEPNPIFWAIALFELLLGTCWLIYRKARKPSRSQETASIGITSAR